MKNRTKKILSLLLACVMLLSIFTACSSKEASPAEASSESEVQSTAPADSSTSSGSETASTGAKDSVIIGHYQEPATLDPNNQGDGAGFQVCANIYESLLALDYDLKIQPCLAETWDISDDGLVYTFHLREGVTFQNGEPLTAADCKFSYERAMVGGYAGSVTGCIDHVEAPDDNTFVIYMTDAFAPALDCFASHFLRIVSQKAVEEAGDSFSYAPYGAGTGPYEFVSWDSGNSIVLKAYEGYWGGAPSIKNATWRYFTDQGTLATAVEAGDVDMGGIQMTDIANLESNPNRKVEVGSMLVIQNIGFQCDKAPYDNALVRQAIAYSYDAEEMLLVAMGLEEGGTLTASPVVNGGLGYNADLAPYPQDIEKAKALLAEAGYPDGFETTIYTPNAAFRKNMATYLQSCLAEINITAKIEVMEQAALLEEIRAGNTPIFIMGFTGTSSDSDFFLYGQYHSGQTYNYDKYENAELDEILDKARTITDTDERDALYREAVQIIYDEVPDVQTFFINAAIGHNADLNITFDPCTHYYVKDWSWNS